MLNTCSITDIPPNPSKKAQIVILVERFFVAIFETAKIPVVSSNIPEIIGDEKADGICNSFNIGDIILESSIRTLPFDSMESITENNTTKPPIMISVLLDSIIAVESTSPKLEKVMNLFLKVGVVDVLWILVVDEFFILDIIPRITPILIADRIWVISNKKPIEVFEKRVTPTVPIMNNGPELFVKQSILSASALVHLLFIFNSETVFAPIGYPLISPIMKA